MDNVSPADPAALYNARAAAEGWSTRCAPAQSFVTPELNALLDIWNAKACGHLPKRGDFDARTLKPFLRNIGIVEQVEGADCPRYRMRYFGSDFVTMFGEQSGRFVDEFIPPESLPRWVLGYEVVLLAGAPMRFTAIFSIPKISFLKGESFSAPLAAEPGAPAMLLTAMYVSSKFDADSLNLSSL